MKKSLSLILALILSLSVLSCFFTAGADAVDIKDATVTVNGYTYDDRYGSPKDADITVVCNGTILSEGTDYTYKTETYDCDKEDCTKLSITVTGIGAYTGEKDESVIVPYDSTGKCGKKARWYADPINKVFMIKGTGAMYNGYISDFNEPFTTLIVDRGITKVSWQNFVYFRNLKYVSIANTVKTLDSYVFWDVGGIEKVNLSKGIEKIGEGCFISNYSLKYVYVPDSVTKISKRAFGYITDDTEEDDDDYAKVKGFTLGGVKGSAAEKYAKKNGFKFIAFKQCSVKALAAKKASFKVKWNKASGATGYQIQYSASKYFVSSKTVTVKGATTLSKTVKKLKSGKKYYVRVRSLKKSGKKTYYSSWSKEKAVKTK
ncbi:MAG: leucine-rich repeat protein [Eubacterium sp.]|nr:leucine-rich repeat protein [Eubacterium sp.]